VELQFYSYIATYTNIRKVTIILLHAALDSAWAPQSEFVSVSVARTPLCAQGYQESSSKLVDMKIDSIISSHGGTFAHRDGVMLHVPQQASQLASSSFQDLLMRFTSFGSWPVLRPLWHQTGSS
jgi:arginine/lysine/ornithine decarboxylase